MTEYTRNHYMTHDCTHREYHGQFVTAGIKQTVLSRIGVNALKASTDEHLNDIPLKRWDALPLFNHSTHEQFKAVGDYVTLATRVCVYKEAAKQIIEGGL